jgi:hypothetical protein
LPAGRSLTLGHRGRKKMEIASFCDPKLTPPYEVLELAVMPPA